MPIMRNTLSEDELYMLDQLESGLRSKYGGELPKDKKSKIDAFEATLNIIPTAAGRKYAISKFLNDDEDFANQDDFPKLNADLWSLKHQEDYTPPDVEKAIEKRNKEQAENFWNWDSDEHWTKKNSNELKRIANDAGYADFAGYLDKVREVQTNKDREKLYDENAMPGTKMFLPRMTEAVLRGEDPSGRDKFLDGLENALYLLNPLGRVTKAGLQGGAWASKYLGRVANVADVLANPLMLETADALAYGDEDNTDRKNFSIGDVALGTGINAGMNKITDIILRKGLRNTIATPVQKSKAQLKAEQSVKDNEPVIQGLTKEPITSSDLLRKIEEEQARAYNLLNEDLIREKYPTAEAKQKLIEMFENKRKMLSDAQNKHMNKVPKTKFSERLLGDLNGLAAIDYISNKAGDYISEDPKITRQVLTRSLRGAPLAGQLISDLARDYYNRKEKNEEQNKINQAIKLLGRRK